MEISDIRLNLLGDERRRDAITTAIRNILTMIGEDWGRDGLMRTPLRVVKAYEEWFGGYSIQDPKKVLDRTFETDYSDMVIVKNIKFYSHCEHHMAPFFGYAHVAYIPKKRIVGLDKIIKLVEVYSRRLQTQEQLTHQIATAINEVLKPRGVGVNIEAEHFCIASRGTRSQDSITITTKLMGLLDRSSAKKEFFDAINNGK